MMIVSKVKLDLSSAPWAAVGAARSRAQGLFEAVTRRSEPMTARSSSEGTTLGELLYRVLIEPMEVAS